ncbi:MAG: gliding motility-associated C-terminal domain-containing protein [Bacteroidia bacterium]|nr:gliding motility-associated C-terminal domain-containing protein [Bacteroidia bacterium]
MKNVLHFFKRVLPLLILLAMALAAGKSLKASHLVGSDITYNCLGSTPGQYQLTMKWYRDCGGIPLCGCPPGPLNTNCSVNLSITGAQAPCLGTNFGNTSIQAVAAGSGFDIIQLCAAAKSICTNCGTRTPGSFTPGIEIYTFTGIVNLSGVPPNCCLVNIGFNDCCRNAAITTLVNPSSLSYYSGCTINKCITPCNSAPTFTNDPVAVTCVGQDFTYNLGAIDPDGDSLSYAYGPVMTGPNSPAPYQSPYSPTVPFPYLGAPMTSPPALPPLGIFIDPVTGDVRFRPTMIFTSNIVIEVTQWKTINGVPTIVGKTTRDIQFYAKLCDENNPPVLRTYNNDGTLTSPQPNYSYAICAGQQLCVIISAWDNTAGWDTTDITWNAPANLTANGATFQPLYNVSQRKVLGPRLDSFRFCWTPPASMANNLPYYFIVTAKDRACPLPSRVTRSFAVTVRRIPLATIIKTNKNCGFYDFGYTLTNNVQLNNSYTQFQVENGPRSNSYVTYTGPTVSNHRFTQAGWHRVKLRLTTIAPPAPNGCPNDNIIDSVYIGEPLDVSIRDTFNCLGSPVSLKSFGKGGTPLGAAYRYTYYLGGLNSTNIVRAESLDSNVTLNPVNAGNNTQYKVLIRDLNNCRDSATFNVFTRNLPVPELVPAMRLCPGTLDTLDAGNSFGSVGTWRWRKSPVAPVLDDSVSQKIIPRDSGVYTVTKTDNFGCVRVESSNIYFNLPVPVSAGPDRTICFNDAPITLTAIGTTAAIDSFQWRAVPVTGSSPVLSNQPTYVISPPTTTQYQVTGYITYGGVTCSNVDTMELKVNELPVINRPTSIPLCRTNNIISLPVVNSTNKTLVNRTWTYPRNPLAISGNQLLVDNLAFLPPSNGNQPYGNYIYIQVVDDQGCSIRDSLLVAVFPVPTINAGPNRTLCDNSGAIFDLRPANQGYSPNGGALAINEEWFGRGVIKTTPGQNYYAFDPKGADVKNLPDTNVLTYQFTTNFPPSNSVLFAPPIAGVSIASPTGGCVGTDTTVFRVIKSPILVSGVGASVCKSGDTINLDTWMMGRSTNATNPQTSYWKMDFVDESYSAALTQGRKFLPSHPVIPNMTKEYKLVYRDTASGCVVEVPASIQVNANPNVDIDYNNPSDSAVCTTNGMVTFFMDPAGAADGGTMFSSPDLPGAFNVAAGTFNLNTPGIQNGVYNVKYYFTDPGTGCSNRDSIDIRVQLPPRLAIQSGSVVCAYDASFTVGFDTVPSSPYGVNWTTPDGNNANIVNNGTSGITYNALPSDITRGTITFVATTTNNDRCAPATDQATFTILPKPDANFVIAPDRGCVDPRYNVTLNSVFTAGDPGVPTPNFNWYEGSLSSARLNSDPANDKVYSRTYTTAGTRTIYLVVESSGCTDTSTAQVFAWPTPVANFSTDPISTTIAKPYFDFFNESTNGDNSPLKYIWYMGPADINGPDRILYDESPQDVKFPADTARIPVKLTVVNQYGCFDSITKMIRVEPDITVFIPSAIYRNSSVPCPLDCNRTFKVAATGFESIDIMVFNRWGQMVFRTNDIQIGWDGTDMRTKEDCQQDAYVYQVNATSFSGKKYSYSGSVTLFR